jgi:hypothetical protein
LRIDNEASIESPDRQGDCKRFDQKPHADGRTAGGDGEIDACFAQPPRCGPGAIGQGLVFCHQRTVDIRRNKGDAGHA